MAQIDSDPAGSAAPQAPGRSKTVTLGALSFLIEEGALRRICWNGVEVVRGLSASVRDENWGSLQAEDIFETRDKENGTFRFTREYGHLNGALSLLVTVTAKSSGTLRAEFWMTAQRDVPVNRAGLNVLHPIVGVAGQVLAVRHGDGSREELEFPVHVAPAQPVRDISGLGHRVGNVRVSFDFDGEVFEMEDQRNWSDASFKTYCRPLSLPFPFMIAKGDVVRQSIEIDFTETAGDTRPAPEITRFPDDMESRAPDVLLAVQPGWAQVGNLPASGLLVRLGADFGYAPGALASLAEYARRSGAYIDAEIVTGRQRDPIAEIREIAGVLTENGIAPRHVVAMPDTYLKSHQPDGPWPDGATPAQCASAVAAVFPQARTGVGALTNFTELNRHQPRPGLGDYITHGNCAIVHAADDRSVMETLEAIPQIFQSGRRIAGDRRYRLGLMAIGMRSNPYGAFLSPNPEQRRKTMTDDDPRQKGLFGAAYAVALAAETARHDIAAIALGAPAGPFGMIGPEGEIYPIYHVVNALARLARQPVQPIARIDRGVSGLRFSGGAIVANCTPVPVEFANPPETAAILDEAAIATAAKDARWISKPGKITGDSIILAPYTCLFSGFEVAS